MSYVDKVAQYFISQNPYITILTPMDYAQIAEWEKQEIPIVIVLNAIKDVLDKSESSKFREIKSISELKEEVRQNYARWLTEVRK